MATNSVKDAISSTPAAWPPGFTAFLVTRLPQRACDLSDSTLDSLKPQEGVDFQKRLVPIFKGDLDGPGCHV